MKVWRCSATSLHPLTEAVLIFDGLVLHHVVLDQVILKQKLQDTNTTTAVKTSNLLTQG